MVISKPGAMRNHYVSILSGSMCVWQVVGVTCVGGEDLLLAKDKHEGALGRWRTLLRDRP